MGEMDLNKNSGCKAKSSFCINTTFLNTWHGGRVLIFYSVSVCIIKRPQYLSCLYGYYEILTIKHL